MSQERIHEVVENHIPNAEFSPERVICLPIDDSEYSEKAIQWTLNTIATNKDQIVLLHVRTPLNEVAGIPPLHVAYSTENLFEYWKTESHKLLRRTAKVFIERNLHVRAISLRGDPRYELEAKINILKPDLVIVGSHSRNVVARMILGSVSNYLLHHLHFPVLLVPIPK